MKSFLFGLLVSVSLYAAPDEPPLVKGKPFKIGVRPAEGLAALDSGTPSKTIAEERPTILFYGNSMIERLMEHGELEAYLQLGRSGEKLRVRSLAWTGDEVGWRSRPEGYVEHLKALLASWPADLVVLGYGMNESFAGLGGLADFRKCYEVYLREIERLHPKAKLVLLSPLAVQFGSLERNREVAAYGAAISDLAQAHRAQFVNLFEASQKAYAEEAAELTEQGIHLNEMGCHRLAPMIAQALQGEEAMSRVGMARVAEVAKAAAQKSRAVAEVVRPKNGVVYFGVRKRPEEYAAEMPRYHQLIELSEGVLHDLVAQPTKQFRDFARPSLPPLEGGKSIEDRFSGGVIKPAAEQQKDLKVAEGYRLNLFASEAEFPELKNPVQMAFDARGRLWVVTMPSFPHTLPGELPQDKILILEDVDRDGTADKCTVFADGLDALDGIAFHERGVLVSAQPRILLLKDLDGDDRADTQTELLRGVDVTDSHHGGMIEVDPLGDLIFCDGVFHRSQFETPFGVVRGIDSTTYRLHLRTGRIESEWQSLTPNPWKVAFDRYGNLFQRFGGGHVLDGLPLTWTPLGAYQPYGNGTVLNYGKGSALSVVSSPNFPDSYQQGFASAVLLGTYCVSISKPEAKAGPIVGVDRLDLLSSQNSAFRPVDCEFGFDGALYVSDFSSRIIGHAQHPMRDPQWNHTRGRIWRVVSNDKPVAKDWPQIESATVAELIALLSHPQNIVRQHARIRLRGMGPEVEQALDQSKFVCEQAMLEALWVLEAREMVRPAWLAQLLRSQDPLFRAAAVQLMRFQAPRLPEGFAMLQAMGQDSHPRVRMALVNAVSHLRANGHVQFEQAIKGLNAIEEPVKQMVQDLKLGVAPIKGRSVPVLEVAPETRVAHWLFIGESGSAEQSAYPNSADREKGKAAPIKSKAYRTYIEAGSAQTALLSVKHGYLDISANGVQLLSADSPYSSEQQVQLELQKGLNLIEMSFRRLKPNAEPPSVHIYDPLGQPFTDAHLPADQAALQSLAKVWDRLHEDGALHVQAVLNQMQFAPKELSIKAGQSVKIIFENQDLMPHNLVLLTVGAEDEVGALADQMATKPDGMAKGFVPQSSKILQATPLIEAKGKAELVFNAPGDPGRYPFICTFPGHWRVMRGFLVVQ